MLAPPTNPEPTPSGHLSPVAGGLPSFRRQTQLMHGRVAAPLGHAGMDAQLPTQFHPGAAQPQATLHQLAAHRIESRHLLPEPDPLRRERINPVRLREITNPRTRISKAIQQHAGVAGIAPRRPPLKRRIEAAR